MGQIILEAQEAAWLRKPRQQDRQDTGLGHRDDSELVFAHISMAPETSDRVTSTGVDK
jgi:hypothetical protein